MKFTATKQDDRLKFDNVTLYREFIAEQAAGGFTIEIKPIRSAKTQKQLGYYYGVVIPAIRRWFDETMQSDMGSMSLMGTRVPIGITDDNIDRYLKILYAHSRGVEERVSKARMTIAEMRDYLEFILGWGHENAIGIPSSDGY